MTIDIEADVDKLTQRQVELERSLIVGEGDMQPAIDQLIEWAETPLAGMKPMSVFLDDWKKSRPSRKHLITEYVRHIRSRDLVSMVATETVRLLCQPDFHSSYRQLCMSIGRTCVDALGDLLQEASGDGSSPPDLIHSNLVYREVEIAGKVSRDGKVTRRRKTLHIEHDERVLRGIGVCLFEHLAKLTKVVNFVRPKGAGEKKTMHPTGRGQELIDLCGGKRPLPIRLPMLIPPYQHGVPGQPAGYYHFDFVPVDLVSLQEGDDRAEEVRASVGYKKISKSINAIQGVGWRVHQRVAAVYLKLKSEGGGVAGICKQFDDLIEPNPKLNHTKRLEVLSALYERRSDSMLEDRREVLVNKYLNEKAFYFPHRCDWRGRAYVDCVAREFSYQGDKVARGLLEFSDGVPVTDIEDMEGLFVQAALCLGKDKMSKYDKVSFVRSKLVFLANYARDPLGDRGWLDCEKPWQLLQCCFVFSDFLDSGSTFPFNCHIPCEADGANNGYQHYAALTRSQSLGRKVNMTASVERHDLYSEVLERVRSLLKTGPVGSFWNEHLSRAIVKPPMITLCYGSGVQGRAETIVGEVRSLADSSKLPAKAKSATYVTYLSGRIEEALRGVADDAMDARDWIQYIARERVKHFENDMSGCFEWDSLIGLPIKNYRGEGADENFRIAHLDPSTEKSNQPKHVYTVYGLPEVCIGGDQSIAAPANYIQSQDASHMHATSVSMAAEGLKMVAVHDAFITDSSNLARLNELLRESFVSLYDGVDPLNDLFKSQKGQLGMLKHPPKQGLLDIKAVQSNEYFFS